MARLFEKYKKEIVPKLREDFGYKNIHTVPALQKIVINMGVKEAVQDIKILDQLVEEVALIVGQRPVITRAKKAISNFKIRQGNPIGLKVTLRRKIMYEFLDRLLNVAMPRIKDFRGVSVNSFDQKGNYSMGIQEQIIFPEVDYDKVKKVQGMDITFVSSANTKEETKKLLEYLGMPFRKR
ncbi:MAG: 50S ribosomal protein L5 [Candidatus Omnitrophica bacterium]|nr:50S ribosomal protein L5 [Candidatus Omnitrophota bacterium]